MLIDRTKQDSPPERTEPSFWQFSVVPVTERLVVRRRGATFICRHDADPQDIVAGGANRLPPLGIIILHRIR
jgi:hypothetical protein